jgi:hypothetical protein
MATYAIVPPKQQQGGYLVQVIGDDGARQTMLGFDSEEQAKAWIEADRQRDARQVPAE